jgi:hypothetical protein
MRLRLFMSLLVCAAVGASAAKNDPAKFENIRKIYVDVLGDDRAAAEIRSGIQLHLTKSGRFDIVDQAGQADAVLSGKAQMTTSSDPVVSTDSLPSRPKAKKTRTHYHASATLELRGQDQGLLWSKEDSYHSVTRKAASALGHQIADSLVKAATPKKK